MLDDVDVPEALRSTVWRTIEDVSSYDTEFDAILHAIFGKSQRPPLGNPPAYATSPTLPNLTPASTALLYGLVHTAIEHDGYMLGSPAWIQKAGDDAGLSEQALEKELHRLERANFVELPDSFGGHKTWHLTVRPLAVLTVLDAEGRDIGQLRRQVVAAIVNDGLRSYPDLTKAAKLRYLELDPIVVWLEAEGLVRASHAMGGYQHSDLSWVDPLLEDELV